MNVRTPMIAGAVVAALASTTGYCVLTNNPSLAPAPATYVSPPVRLLPQAIVPYSPDEQASPDALK